MAIKPAKIEGGFVNFLVLVVQILWGNFSQDMGVVGALNRDSPDGSSQSPIMVAQWASDVYSALSCHDRPWSALDRADLAMGNPAPSRFRAVRADFDPRRTHLSCRAT